MKYISEISYIIILVLFLIMGYSLGRIVSLKEANFMMEYTARKVTEVITDCKYNYYQNLNVTKRQNTLVIEYINIPVEDNNETEY